MKAQSRISSNTIARAPQPQCKRYRRMQHESPDKKLEYISHAATALSFSRAASPTPLTHVFDSRLSQTVLLPDDPPCPKLRRAWRAVIFRAVSFADFARLLYSRPSPTNFFWQVTRAAEKSVARAVLSFFYGGFTCHSHPSVVQQIPSNESFW